MATAMNEEKNRRARDEALSKAAALSVEPTTMVGYASRGVVAVLGDAAARNAVAMMPATLTPHLVVNDDDSAQGTSCTRIRNREVSLNGYLGSFRLMLTDPASDEVEAIEADLVLELNVSPLLDMPLTPPGYFTGDASGSELADTIGALADMTGSFEKPKFFDYNPSICAHGRSGKTACTRCIDACPAEAISSLGEMIEVEPHLCQGGGACATACPSGAIRYLYPTADDTLTVLRTLLRAYRDAGGEDPLIVFHARETTLPETFPANVLPVGVEELASVGLEVWLSALAYGAGAVLLLSDDDLPQRVAAEVDDQLATAVDILSGMGYPPGVINRVDADGLMRTTGAVMPPLQAAAYAGASSKRQTAFMAIDALYDQALSVLANPPMDRVALSASAPFGTASIDEKSCTLCQSCVSACPGKALQSGQDVPQVRFIESNCLQCGVCTLTCPEDAISISPRLLFEREQRNAVTTLHEEPPFCCVSCGKPFATRSVIDNMMAKLEGHWMFSDERSRQRLMMCEDCRVVDVVQDQDMMDRDLKQDRVTH